MLFQKYLGQFFPMGQTTQFTIYPKNPESITFDLAIMATLDNQPAYFVENIGFKLLMKSILPKYQIPTRKTIASKVERIYNTIHESVKLLVNFTDIQNNGYCLLWDHWKSKHTNKEFISIILRYVNENFEPKSLHLRVFEVNDKTSSNLIIDLETTLKTFNLIRKNDKQDLHKRFCCTDMSSSNISAVLKSSFMYEEHQIICFSHSLHNSLKAAFDKSINIKSLIGKVHSNNSWFRYSIQRLQSLEEVFQKQQQKNMISFDTQSDQFSKSECIKESNSFKKPKLENNTRWWSVNVMLESFINNYVAIKEFYTQDNEKLLQNEITQSEFLNIKAFFQLLQDILWAFNKFCHFLKLVNHELISCYTLLIQLQRIQRLVKRSIVYWPSPNTLIFIGDLIGKKLRKKQ